MKKLVIIALCFLASFKANTQVIDTTINGCFAAPLKYYVVVENSNFKKDTATHFAFIQDLSTQTCWNVTVAFRSKTENFRLVELKFKREEYDGWDGYNESLLRILLAKVNSDFKTSFQFK